MKISNAVFLLPMLATLLSNYCFASVQDEPINDPAYQYNCELTVLDGTTKEILGHKILRNGYNDATVTPTPPGNGRALLLEETANSGIVDAYEMYMPARTIKDLFKKHPEQATIKIYRRVGLVESDPEMGLSIPRVESDTLLGQIEVKGSTNQIVSMDKYIVGLACIQNPDKK